MIHCREEILPANNTLDTSLATPEANIHVIRDNKESKKPDKEKTAMETHKEGES